MSKTKFTVQASDEAKRKKKSCSSSAKKDVRFKADMVTCDEEFETDPEIVFFVDGKLEFRGEFSREFADKLIYLCEKNKYICEELYEWCNSFGDPLLDEDATPREVAEMAEEVMWYDYQDSEYDEFGFYETFEESYNYGDNAAKWPRMECFLASELA